MYKESEINYVVRSYIRVKMLVNFNFCIEGWTLAMARLKCKAKIHVGLPGGQMEVNSDVSV